jgi:hypothetical protein
MKPRIHGVLTPWIPGFTASCALRYAPCALRAASGSRPPRHPLRNPTPCEPEGQPNER